MRTRVARAGTVLLGRSEDRVGFPTVKLALCNSFRRRSLRAGGVQVSCNRVSGRVAARRGFRAVSVAVPFKTFWSNNTSQSRSMWLTLICWGFE